MKTLAIYLLLFSLLANLGYKSMVHLGFYFAQDYLAKEHCEQKEIKNNCCQASCVLEKGLSLQEETQAFLDLQEHIELFYQETSTTALNKGQALMEKKGDKSVYYLSFAPQSCFFKDPKPPQSL